jgi:cytochrome c biogenesis protein CcdA
MDIKVLGDGCYGCLQLELLVGQVLDELGLPTPVRRVSDRKEMDRAERAAGLGHQRPVGSRATPANPRGTASLDHGGSELGKTCMNDLKKAASLLTLLLICGRLLLPVAQAEEPVVRAVLFWSKTCSHCHVVINETLPGEQWQIELIETSEPTGYEMYRAAVEAYGVPPDRQGMPALFIGHHHLVGSVEIPKILPGLIEQYLAAGGVDYPAIPGLVAEPKLTPTPYTSFTPWPTPTIKTCHICDEEKLPPTPMPTAAADDAPAIHLAYFYQPGCRECDRVQLDLNYLQHRYPQLVIHTFDVKAEAALAEWLGERAGVPEEKRLTAPAVFVGDEGLVDEALHARSLEELIARHAATGAEAVWEEWETAQSQAAEGIVERFRSFGLLTVLAAGLVDGLNPCAFATIVFFISYLAFVGRKGREVLAVGAAFALGVFLTYLGVGVGLLKFLASLPFLDALSRWVYGLTAALCLFLALGSLYDWWQARRGKPEEMRLKLPTRLRRWINRVIREGSGLRAFVPMAFVTGAVISVIELACTGQVYLPTILFVLGVPGLRVRAGAYLVLYNLMFVLPLVVVFLLAYFGTTSQQLSQFINRRAATIKLATAGLFLLLAGWLVMALA